jgi:hypothetical protein
VLDKPCKCCGRPIAYGLITGTRRRRCVQIIAEHPGLSSREIIERLYAGEDGPDSRQIISVFVFHANRILRAHGYQIVGSTNRSGGYRLVRYG